MTASTPTPTPTPTPAPLDDDAAGRLRAIIGRLARQLRTTRSATGAELSPTRISLLLAIDRRGPVRLSEVGEAEGLNPTMLSRSVAQLADGGLVTRTSDEGDRRAAWVRCTAAGHALAERMRAERTRAVNTALEGLPAPDRRTLAAAIPALERLAEALREVRP
jgi:DNA-binding MarR family transcriptional regulator